MAILTTVATILITGYFLVFGGIPVESQMTLNLTNFASFPVTPSGCENTPNTKSQIHCGISCLNDPQCRAFNHYSGICKICPREQMLDLTFGGGHFFFPRSQGIYNIAEGEVLVELERPLVPGDVIYLAITTWTTDSEHTDLILQSDTVVYQFLYFSISVKSKSIRIRSFPLIPPFNPPRSVKDPFTFAEHKRSDVFFLATVDKFLIYTDTLFLCEFDYPVPLENLKRLSVVENDNYFVHELSV